MGATRGENPLLIGSLEILSAVAVHGPHPLVGHTGDGGPAGMVLAVAADLLALIVTTVLVVTVRAIVTGFITFFSYDDVAPYKTVATTGGYTICQAAILIAPVTVIASFHANLGETIATAGLLAIVKAIVPIVFIPIITGLETRLSLLDVEPERTVATCSRPTGNAGVTGVLIAIVAVLKALGARC